MAYQSKYKAKTNVIDGIKFDSIMESNYYLKLVEDRDNGLIKDFELQPEFMLQEGFVRGSGSKKYRPIMYIADFRVIRNDGSSYIVDIKGFETQEFKLKKKMYMYLFKEPLLIITNVACYGGWIELEDLKRIRRENNRAKKRGRKKGGKNRKKA